MGNNISKSERQFQYMTFHQSIYAIENNIKKELLSTDLKNKKYSPFGLINHGLCQKCKFLLNEKFDENEAGKAIFNYKDLIKKNVDRDFTKINKNFSFWFPSDFMFVNKDFFDVLRDYDTEQKYQKSLSAIFNIIIGGDCLLMKDFHDKNVKMDDSLQSKQAYLRENVLEMGYDADEFMAFLQLRKGDDGLDLNNWTITELISVVNDFIKAKNNIKNKNEEQEADNEEENTPPNVNIENDNKNSINNDISNNIENSINNNEPNTIYEDENDNIGKCLTNELTSFSNIDNIQVKLSSPKKNEGGMFQKSFISYIVTTMPFNFQTNKRYSDFAWLKKILSLIYSNCVIPPLCKKNFTDRFTEYLIEKRMRSIEKFMSGILEHPLMKNSSVVKDFLSLSEGKEYNNKVNIYNRIKKQPSLVREMKTLNGEINIEINNEKETYFENIKNYAKGNFQLLQKITRGYKSLMNIMQQLSNKMKDISKLWKLVLDKSITY